MSLDYKEEKSLYITSILDTIGYEDTNAHQLIVATLYDELRALAHRHVSSYRPELQMDTTELVHEAYIKLDLQGGKSKNRGHFFSLAAKTMRHILIDIARKNSAIKRGEGLSDITFNDDVIVSQKQTDKWLEIEESIQQLKKFKPRLVEVIECRFFGGLTEDETAEALNVNVRTVQRDWRRAKMWIKQFLERSKKEA